MEHPIQLFGYLREQDLEPCCMVSNVTRDTVKELGHYGLRVGDWFLSSGQCDKVIVYGPYKNADIACEEAQAKFGVTKLTSPLINF